MACLESGNFEIRDYPVDLFWERCGVLGPATTRLILD